MTKGLTRHFGVAAAVVEKIVRLGALVACLFRCSGSVLWLSRPAPWNYDRCPEAIERAT